jgi:predicted Zn-dependent peptidase
MFSATCGFVSYFPLKGLSSIVNEKILSHRFSNGLVLIAEPMPWLQSAAFTFLVPAGSAFDPLDRGGLSGFTCEMALRGAGKRDSRQFIVDLDNLGVERSETVANAHTSYHGATLAENLPAAMEIYADVLRSAHLPDDQLEASRLGMLQELQAVEDEPAQKVMIELRRRHYPLPWGRPSQGERQSLETISNEEIKSHYRRHYRPEGTILGVAGRFDWDALKDRVGRLLGDWTAGDGTDVVDRPVSARYEHLPFESNQTQIGIAYASVPYNHPDYFQAWGAVGVLSGGMSSRLFTEVRERRGLCYSVYASYHSLRHRGGVFCYAGTGAERAQETLDVTLGELVRMKQGIEEQELDRLKARIKSALVMQQESSSGRSSSLAFDWYHLGRARTLEEVEGLIDRLSSKTINAFLAENPPKDFTVVTLGPNALEMNDE